MSKTANKTEGLNGQLRKRINRSALTHQQKISEVMDSLTVDKKLAHLMPIITNVVRTILDEGNKWRLQKAANSCVSAVHQALYETYLPEQNSCGWFPLSSGPDNIYIPPTTDSQGNIIKDGRWVYESEDEYDTLCYSRVQHPRDFDGVLISLQEAVARANKSQVFQTAGVELIVTDDCLVFGGMRS